MRRKWILTRICAGLLLTASMSVTSCSNDMQTHGNGPQEVGIYIGDAATRTVMQPNGLSASWEAGDKISLWAVSASGANVLDNQLFIAYGLDGQAGYFTSTLQSPMPDGSYTYLGCYPQPVSADGHKVTFMIPSIQDGKVSGGADIMVASPAQSGPLKAITSEASADQALSMRMNRMLHQFRFYIPEELAAVGDEKITRLQLIFPRNVVGKIAFDLADPSQGGVLSDAGNVLTIEMPDGLSRSSGGVERYACVAFAPTAFASGEHMTVNAYTDSKIAVVDPIDLRARDFKAGHSTPVQLLVKEIKDYPYQFTVKVSLNNLGEEVNTMILTAPSGCRFADNQSNVYTYSPGHKITVGEEIVFRFEDVAQFMAFSGKTLNITFDSDNALTSTSVVLPDLSLKTSASVSVAVPYLFSEDFSGIPDFSDGHDAPSTGMNSDTYKGITELSSLTSYLSGWYGTRIGGKNGTSIRICCRYENVLSGKAYYKGRVYTPFLSNIKEGRDVKIMVSFKYGSSISERDPLFGSPPKASPMLYFGINTQEQVVNADDTDLIGGVISGSGYGNAVPTSLSPMAINGEAMATSGGSYTSFAGTRTVTIEGIDNHMRLAWIVSSTNTSGNTNGNYWLYLDEIKVRIVE